MKHVIITAHNIECLNCGTEISLVRHGISFSCPQCKLKMELKIEVTSKEFEETHGDQKMFYINGDKRSFRCECGCNVFRELKHKPSYYKCNACNNIYESVK